MKFLFYFFSKTALFLAIEKNNYEIVKLLIDNDKIDINSFYVFIKILLMKFKPNVLIKFYI